MFERSGRHFRDGLGQPGRTAFGQEDAVGPGALGAAQDGAQVLGILDLVQQNEKRRRAGRRQNGLEGIERFGRQHGHDALMMGRRFVQDLLGDEEIRDMGFLGQADDDSQRPVALLLLEKNLIDPPRRRLQDLDQRVDADDAFHGALAPGIISCPTISARTNRKSHEPLGRIETISLTFE